MANKNYREENLVKLSLVDSKKRENLADGLHVLLLGLVEDVEAVSLVDARVQGRWRALLHSVFTGVPSNQKHMCGFLSN